MNQLDDLLRSFAADAPVDDRAERSAIDAARRTLRAAIAAEERGSRGRRRQRRLVLLFAALALAGVAVPALGVATGWLGRGGEVEGVRGSAPPQLTSRPTVVASGEPNERWAIVIARSHHGLCLNVDAGDERFDPGNHRLGDCGYLDLRGELPPDVRGDPRAPCIGSTALVPCGSRPEYWLAVRSWGTFVPQARRSIVVGATAPEVASVELRLAGGGRLEAQVVERPLGSGVRLNVFWATLGREHGLQLRRNAAGELWPCAHNVVEEIVARDAQGNVLGRRVPAWNANPSGDPDGPRPPAPLRTDSCV